MTRIACFNNLASLDPNHYVVYDNARDRVAVRTAEQLGKFHRLPVAGNDARKVFLESLKREYPEIVEEIDYDIGPLLQQNGKPLQSRHVIWVLDRVDELNAMKKSYLLFPVTSDDSKVFYGAGKQTTKSPPLLESPAERGEEPDLSHYQDSSPTEVVVPTSPVGGAEPPRAWLPPAQRQRAIDDPKNFLNRSRERRESKGKEREYEPHHEDAPPGEDTPPLSDNASPPGGDTPSPSTDKNRRINTNLYGRFKAIRNELKTEADKSKKIRIRDDDVPFAELFQKRPDCKALDDCIHKGAMKNVSLAQHWELPRKMEDWIGRLINAESVHEANQVKREMDLHVEQLRLDIRAIEDALASGKLTIIESPRLDAAHKQLVKMCEQLESPDKSPWTELGDYLENIRPNLPATLPDTTHHYIALKRLEKIGITSLVDNTPLPGLANRMTKAYALLQIELQAGGTWEVAYQKASQPDRSLLDEYRQRCLKTIRDKVNTKISGVIFDEKTKTYGTSTESDEPQYHRRVSWQVDTVVRSQWGVANLWTALGYANENDDSAVTA